MSRTEAGPPAVVTAPGVGLRSERGPVLLALMLADRRWSRSTPRSSPRPCRPSSRDLGGFSQFPWLFSIYLLAQAVSTPIYGRLADLFGRKPAMLARGSGSSWSGRSCAASPGRCPC